MPTFEDYTKFLAGIRKATGLDMLNPDASGLVTVRVQDEFNLSLQFIEATGKILCFVEVAELPKDAGREVYRDLLAGGLFGQDTAGGYFALETETETVVYNYLFDFDRSAANPEEFFSTLEKILQLCGIWVDRIRTDLSSPGAAQPDVPAAEPAEAQPAAESQTSFHLMP